MKMFVQIRAVMLVLTIVISTLFANGYFNNNVLAGEELPLIDIILKHSENRTIDDMDSGWSVTYGYISYDNTSYVNSNSSLKGTPNQIGTEKLRFYKTFNPSLNLSNCNLGFWVKTSGEIPSDFTFYLETYDNMGRVRVWRSYRTGTRLQGSDKVWSHHFIMSTSYISGTTIDMTNIIRIVFRFVASNGNWTFSIDDLRAYPNQLLFPNGAVVITFDGPYDRVFYWAGPKLLEYNYSGVVATARTNGVSLYDIERMKVLYNNGWDFCVYARMYDYSSPPLPLPLETIIENTAGEVSWLNSKGFTRGTNFIQCNRHLLDVYTEDLLNDDFYFTKGSSWLAGDRIAFPSVAFYGASHSFEQDMATLERAHTNKDMFIWFNHLDGGTYPTAYTQAQFNAFIDKIHELGMEVVTYSQLLERYTQYLQPDEPDIPDEPDDPKPQPYNITVTDGIKTYIISLQNATELDNLINYLRVGNYTVTEVAQVVP